MIKDARYKLLKIKIGVLFEQYFLIKIEFI